MEGMANQKGEFSSDAKKLLNSMLTSHYYCSTELRQQYKKDLDPIYHFDSWGEKEIRTG